MFAELYAEVFAELYAEMFVEVSVEESVEVFAARVAQVAREQKLVRLKLEFC